MERAIRFGAYVQGTGWRQRTMSCNRLPLAVRFDATPASPVRLPAAFLSRRLGRESRTLLPLAAFLVLFQALLLRQPLTGVLGIVLGLLALLAGLALLIEGLREGLMPLAGRFGEDVVARTAPPAVFALVLLLGVVAALSQPGMAALRLAGSTANASGAPFVYALLHGWAPVLLAIVALSVGAAVLLGLLRSLQGWSLKPLIVLVLILAAGLSLHVMADPRLAGVVELAWDVGAAVTGPVTVALLLGSGTGMTLAAGSPRPPLPGLGITALALLVPVIGTLLLALVLAEAVVMEDIVDGAAAAASAAAGDARTGTPWAETLAAARGVIPAVLFVSLVLAWVAGERVRHGARLTAGIVMCLLGLLLFEMGTRHGLEALSAQSARAIPNMLPGMGDASHFALVAGGAVVVLFIGAIVFGASRSEPALAALAGRLADLSHGTLRETRVRRIAALSAAAGAAAGIFWLLLALPATWLLLPGYAVAGLLTALLPDDQVAMAWDSGGAAIGPLVAAVLLPVAVMAAQAANPGALGVLALATLGSVLGMLGAGIAGRRAATAGVRL